MLAVIEALVVCGVLSMLFAKGSLKYALLLSGLVSMPFRTDIGVLGSGSMGWADGVVLSISQIIFIALGLYLQSKNEIKVDFSSNTVRAIALVVLACLLSMVNANPLRMTVFEIILLAQLLLIYYVVISCSIRTHEDLEFAGRAVAVALALHGGIGCAQFVLRNNFLLFSTGHATGQTLVVDAEEGGMMRVFGVVGKPNGYAMILAPMLLMNVVLMIETTRDRLLRVIATVLGASGLVLSFSRGGWLSTSMALGGYLFIRVWTDRQRRFQLLAGAAFSALILGLLFLPLIEKRFTTDDENAAMSRLPLARVALQMIQKHPFVGVGGNTYEFVMKFYRPDDYGINYQHIVHNQYLLMFAELGILGFGGFCWMLVSIFQEDRACLRRKEDRLVSAVGMGALLVLLQACIHMNVDMYSSRTHMGLFLGFAALAAGAKKLEDYDPLMEERFD